MTIPRPGPNGLTALTLFALVFLTHAVCPLTTSGDSRWIMPRMVSLLSHGDLDLNEFSGALRSHEYYLVECVGRDYAVTVADPIHGCPPDARIYSTAPYGTIAVALLPMLAMDATLRLAGPPLLRAGVDRTTLLAPLLHGDGLRIPAILHAFLSRDYVNSYSLAEMVLASFLMGVTAAMIFLTSLEFLSRRRAVVLALLFAYATPAWSTGSRSLCQHGPEMLMLAAALYLLVTAARHPSRIVWSALPLALAYFIRPTGAIALAALGLYVLLHHRRRFVPWATLAAATAVPFLIGNYLMYHRLLQPYFRQQIFLPIRLSSAGPFLVAFAGHCLSPSRGLFVFSPFLLFAVAGIGIAVRLRFQTPLVYYLAAILLLHWIVISAFVDWTAGASYGPRYFSDLTPIFLFFLIPLFASRAPRVMAAAFAVTVLISVAIHLRGAVSWEPGKWNLPSISSARAWDWRDPQFLRGLHPK